MNIKMIKELVDLMNDNGLTEVEVEQEGMKIKLTKNSRGLVEQVVAPVAVSQEGPVPSAQAADTKPQAKSNTRDIIAPMVGTFYRSPAPDADPYVEVGDVIQKGDVLCIVEAMKLMNEVKAEFGGKVVQVCVDNAEAVEYGQTLFVVEPL